MRRQRRFHSERLVTHLAFESPRFGVRGLMIYQLLLGHKTLIATRKRAREWFVSCVAVDMPHEFRLVAEIDRLGGLEELVVFGAILPVTAICSVFSCVIGFDVVVECLGGLKTKVAGLIFVKEPTAAEMTIQRS